jgi:hypothetical protein
MSDRHQDPELRARFEALKRVDAGRAPAFADVWTQAQDELAGGAREAPRRDWAGWRVSARRYGWAGGLAVAATIAALIVIPRFQSNEDAFVQAVRAFEANPALGGWRSPTDGLLDLPGSRLISTIPSMGTTQQ